MNSSRRVTLAAAGMLVLGLHAASAQQSSAQPGALTSWVTEQTRTGFAAGFGISPEISSTPGLSAVTLAPSPETQLAELRSKFAPAELGLEDRILFRRFEHSLEYRIAAMRWSDYSYVFTDSQGPHLTAVMSLTWLLAPALATFFSSRPGSPDMVLSRLESGALTVENATSEFARRAALGFLPPKRMFKQMIEEARATITGAPFNGDSPSPPLAAVMSNMETQQPGKVDETKLAQVKTVLLEKWGPAYQHLIAELEKWESKAPAIDGVSAMPGGLGYFDFLVASNTDGKLTADKASEIGERELQRIHGEMKSAMKRAGFKGTLAELFEFLRTDDRFYFPDTDAGRNAYLAEARRQIDAMATRLGEVVPNPPQGPLEITRFPPAGEAESPSAVYAPVSGPALPASTLPGAKGVFTLNLADMRAAPKYLLQALAFHEGLPGHHLQSQLAPPTNFFGLGTPGDAAYVEGWGLYAERLASEMGAYTDPWSEIGRLGMEAWRAARLIVDTGIHARGWPQEKAARFLLDNTPLTKAQARIEARRQAEAPGRATSYMIGMLKILELRERARKKLGNRFDLRAFHAEALRHGPMPLAALDEVIDRWISAQPRARAAAAHHPSHP